MILFWTILILLCLSCTAFFIKKYLAKKNLHIQEDILKYLLKRELEGNPASIDAVTGNLQASHARILTNIRKLLEDKKLTTRGQRVYLTEFGRKRALQILRAHRILETWLAEFSGFDETDWHKLADEAEHNFSEDSLAELAAKLNHPLIDPHGDIIPEANGLLPVEENSLILDVAPINSPLKVTHIEDEPSENYKLALQLGLRPGQILTIKNVTPEGIKALINGSEIIIPHLAAAQINVNQIAEPPISQHEIPLNKLKLRTPSSLTRIDSACIGAQRRRLLDLGFVPGSEIIAEFTNPSGNPVAYRVRGALIALRHDQACHIFVTPNKN